ncbi:MAG: hypothetical protein HKN57_01935 [Xanthomonadales bacterium]|nr:hypothetical protein [Gammaproteobacteria bacterium]MBT8053900.1 hypothetical protein [Gammaproteobacteria bacterium]NND55987.1 hypothetical protein [Xanthomonadales bacterium]
MGVKPVSENMRIGPGDVMWLVVAVLFHASLLLVPLYRSDPPGRPDALLTVSLLAPTADQTLISEPQEPEAQVPAPAPPRPASEPEAPEKPDESEFVAEREEPSAVNDAISTARLIDSASRFKWFLPEKQENRTLGVPVPRRIPDNWRPLITVGENRFNGMTAPVSTEIVDRWVAADGSHNVVIDTPGGKTLCGRARAWDPMNPLIEPVMMFRTCGGGGKRDFKMPDRFLRHLVK